MVSEDEDNAPNSKETFENENNDLNLEKTFENNDNDQQIDNTIQDEDNSNNREGIIEDEDDNYELSRTSCPIDNQTREIHTNNMRRSAHHEDNVLNNQITVVVQLPERF